MDKGSVLQVLGQVSAEEAGKVFREYLRGATREILIGVMAEEVTALCGAAYHPNEEGGLYRAGSAEGYAYVESRRKDIVRPLECVTVVAEGWPREVSAAAGETSGR